MFRSVHATRPTGSRFAARRDVTLAVVGVRASFEVDITRTAVRHLTLQVEADTQELAEAKALNEAGNHVFPSEPDATYEVGEIRAKPPKAWA